MLTHTRPPLSPDLAGAVNADAAPDDVRRKWWSRLLAAHLECVSDYRAGQQQIEIEAHEGAMYSISTDGSAAVVLRHAFALPAGRCTIKAEDAHRYIASKGWAPLGATAEHDTFPDVRVCVAPHRTAWRELVDSGAPLGVSLRLLALPFAVARRLGVRGAVYARIMATGRLDPITVTARIGAADAYFILMPSRLND